MGTDCHRGVMLARSSRGGECARRKRSLPAPDCGSDAVRRVIALTCREALLRALPSERSWVFVTGRPNSEILLQSLFASATCVTSCSSRASIGASRPHPRQLETFTLHDTADTTRNAV
jgi:hypothetical protein